jgi:hypothetical protein
MKALLLLEAANITESHHRPFEMTHAPSPAHSTNLRINSSLLGK